jgi:hypothetical protein
VSNTKGWWFASSIMMVVAASLAARRAAALHRICVALDFLQLLTVPNRHA